MSLTVHLGDIPLAFDTSRWNELIGQHLQHAFDYEELSPGKRALVRVGMKVLMREVLNRFERASIAGAITAPPPDQDRADEDVLTYGASYIAAFLIAEIEKISLVADYHEGENGAICITGLHPAPALAPAGEPGAVPLQLSGPTSGPDRPEALTLADAPQPSQPGGDSGESGGYLDAGGDERDGQDTRGQAADTGVVAAIP